MYKLTVVAGPDRGRSYSVRDGENSIGRNSENVVVLRSTQVSKRHCVLVVANGELVVRDQGSSNGTFVNGQLTRERNVKVGDRISVGDFVLEIAERTMRPPTMGGGEVIPFPVVGGVPGVPGQHGAHPTAGAFTPAGSVTDMAADAANAVPTDLRGKALWYFERFVMPIFYGFNQRNQWRSIGIGLLALFALANLVLCVQPLLIAGRNAVIREAGHRATYMAREIAERNAPFLAARAETKTDVGAAEGADAVRVAVLTDLDGRIIAPSNKMNQYLTSGGEAVIANQARDLFRKGRETGIVAVPDPFTVVAIEPVKVVSTAAGKNVTIAMAIVSIDTSLTTLGASDMGLVYSQMLILTMIFGGIVLLILYRMTLKPLQILGDDIDKALKGDLTQVTHEFKMEELNPLWDLVNSALQRLPRSGGGATGAAARAGSESAFNLDEFATPFRVLGEPKPGPNVALVVCDGERKVQFVSASFEEISGIRGEGAIGQELAQVGRDQAFTALMTDLFDRAGSSPGGVGEDYDFSGIGYRVHVTAYQAGGLQPKAYVVTAAPNGGE